MASLLYYVNLSCIISKPSVNWNWSYFLETLNSGHNWRFLSRVTLKFDGWPCKTKWHLFYATSSLVHHLMAMGEFKLELQSRSAQFYGKINEFFLRMTLKNNKAPSYATLSSVHHCIVICEFKLELSSAYGLIRFWPHWPWPLTTDLCLLHGHPFWHG